MGGGTEAMTDDGTCIELYTDRVRQLKIAGTMGFGGLVAVWAMLYPNETFLKRLVVAFPDNPWPVRLVCLPMVGFAVFMVTKSLIAVFAKGPEVLADADGIRVRRHRLNWVDVQTISFASGSSLGTWTIKIQPYVGRPVRFNSLLCADPRQRFETMHEWLEAAE